MIRNSHFSKPLLSPREMRLTSPTRGQAAHASNTATRLAAHVSHMDTWQGVGVTIAPVRVLEPPSPPPRSPPTAPPLPPTLPPAAPSVSPSAAGGSATNATTGIGSAPAAQDVIADGDSSSSTGVILAIVGATVGLAALFGFVRRRQRHASSRSVWLATLKPRESKPETPPSLHNLRAQSSPLPSLQNQTSSVATPRARASSWFTSFHLTGTAMTAQLGGSSHSHCSVFPVGSPAPEPPAATAVAVVKESTSAAEPSRTADLAPAPDALAPPDASDAFDGSPADAPKTPGTPAPREVTQSPADGSTSSTRRAAPPLPASMAGSHAGAANISTPDAATPQHRLPPVVAPDGSRVVQGSRVPTPSRIACRLTASSIRPALSVDPAGSWSAKSGGNTATEPVGTLAARPPPLPLDVSSQRLSYAEVTAV